MEKKNTQFVLILFLLGIFMGAIDTGIVSPGRELIQNSFNVSASIGTWMITLYTLVYAISMPIVSKMADRYGYKRAYLFGIATFGIGSLLCGLSNFYGSFGFFLFARAVQAIGAGGILPIASSVIGNSFPEEKRGMALGLVGMIYGVGNILGPTMGSGILDIVGTANWGWIFFINVPISLAILFFSNRIKTNTTKTTKPLDLAGAVLLGAVIASLMYALTNLDFFNFAESIKATNVYPYLISFIVLTPIMVYVEKKAQDPILDMKFFTNRQMLLVLIAAFIVGVGMMGMIFVPQFSENILMLKAGTGGYLVTLLALFSGIAAPVSGKLIDKKGAPLVLGIGFVFTILGTLFLGFFATQWLNFAGVLIGLALMGLGVGFTMGAPLNYLVLQNVSKEEGASGIAAMSLMRSIGLTISPSILIGFIVQAGKNLQSNLMSVLPINSNMTGSMTNVDPNTFKSLQSADVTTIVPLLKEAILSVIPNTAASFKPMIAASIDKAADKITTTYQATLNTGYEHMYYAAAIIAALGLLTTLLMRKSNKE